MQGERLRKLRIEKKVSQPKLAEILDVDVSTIGKWEIHNATPSARTLIELADFFNVSVDYLLGRETENKNISLAFDEECLLSQFKKCNNDNKHKIITYVNSIVYSQDKFFDK